MKSIKTKLILFISILVLLSSISLGFLAVWSAGTAITDEAEDGLASVISEAQKERKIALKHKKCH